MKKWYVECLIDNKEQYEGKEPHNDIRYDVTNDFVEAETAEEAVEFTIDWIVEQSARNCYEAERTINSVVVYDDDGDILNYYYEFRAREVNG